MLKEFIMMNKNPDKSFTSGDVIHFKESGSIVISSYLGSGKSGHSYLAHTESKSAVLKEIHSLPCEYYIFDDKLKSEIDAYETLSGLNISIPELYEVDYDNQYILKEFIDGYLCAELVIENKVNSKIYKQLFQIAHETKINGLNIDFFPDNFVVKNEIVYYIDYEVNPYIKEWDLSEWGLFYWVKL
jgi:TP53 regulating kinase-like protein